MLYLEKECRNIRIGDPGLDSIELYLYHKVIQPASCCTVAVYKCSGSFISTSM